MTTTMTTMTGTTSPNPVVAPAHVHDLLNRLHAQSTQQEKLIDPKVYTIQDTEEFDNIMRDQFVALDQDKCQFIYQIARMIKATQIVEAGTSFGVSTIYLALAVHQVLLASRGGDETAVSREDGRVIATEKESEKIEIARQHWKEAGDEVERFIDLREGDLLKTLRGNIFRVDLLLLDSKYFLIQILSFFLFIYSYDKHMREEIFPVLLMAYLIV